MRFALIHNPNSRRNDHDGNSFLPEAQRLLGDLCISTQHDERLIDHIRTLYHKNIDIIALNGGDGTVSSCLTVISEVYPHDKLPSIIILPSGNTNLIASDVGLNIRGLPAIEFLLAAERLQESYRAPIKLSWPQQPERAPVLGMFGGASGYARAVHIAHSPTILKFASHDLAVFFTILSSIVSLFFYRSRHKWLKGSELIQTDMTIPFKSKRSFLFIATSLKKLSNGIWPFWIEREIEIEKGFYFLNVNSFPKNLLSAIMNLLRGRAPIWLRQHGDYQSDFVEKLEFITDSDFILDGEEFPSSTSHKILLEKGPVFRFLHK